MHAKRWNCDGKSFGIPRLQPHFLEEEDFFLYIQVTGQHATNAWFSRASINSGVERNGD
jgi:hypothetical protein